MLNTIVDLSHYNGNNLDFAAAAESGIDAIIHKATQGLAFIDPRHAINRDAARAVGLLVGSFHFGTDEDGAAQARYFLDNAQPRPDDLLALDFEANSAGSTMTPQQARDFLHLPLAEECCRARGVERDNSALCDIKIDGSCKPDRLVKARLRRAIQRP